MLRTVLSKYWDKIKPQEWLFEKNEYGKPTIKNKSLPISLHFNLSHTQEMIVLAVTLGQEIDVKIIKKEGNRLDLSIKALQKTPYEEFYDAHKVGDSVTGTVFQKPPFGIIVEVAKDVRGLLHKNEFSWNPNDNYESFVKIGDDTPIEVTKEFQKGFFLT